MANYAIIRLGKIKQANLNKVKNHNFRKNAEGVKNANPALTHLNKVLYGNENFIENVKENVEKHNSNSKRALRKDAVLLVDGICTFSPEAAASINVEKWAEDSLDYLKKEFGENLEYAVLHMDEQTPHIHFAVSPKIENKLNGKKFMNVSLMRRIQEKYPEAVAHHGLVRGQEKSMATHTTIKEFYSSLESAKDGVKISAEAKKQLKEITSKNVTRETLLESAQIGLKEGKKAVKALNAKLGVLEKENASNAHSVASMKEKTRALKATNLVTVLKAYGATLDKHDHSKFLTNAGSISVRRNSQIWSNFGAGVSGKGAIDLVMHLEECDFVTARKWLINNVSSSELGILADLNFHVENNFEAKELKMPKAVIHPEKTIKYLTEERCLDRRLVEKLIHKKQIFGTKNKGYENAVFVYENAGEAVGAEIRMNHDEGGSLKRWKAEGSKNGVFFVESGYKEVAICESPIDAISYVQMNPNSSAIATGGVGGIEAIKLFQYEKKETFNIEDYVAASDNDPAGVAFANRLKMQGLVTGHKKPVLKDFNADLVQQHRKELKTASAASEGQFKQKEKGYEVVKTSEQEQFAEQLKKKGYKVQSTAQKIHLPKLERKPNS